MTKIKMEVSKGDKYFLKLMAKNSFLEVQPEVFATISFSATGPYIELMGVKSEESPQLFKHQLPGNKYKIKRNQTVIFTTKKDLRTFIVMNYGTNIMIEADRVFDRGHIFYQDDEWTEFRNFVQIRTNENILFQVVAIWREPTTESNKHLKAQGDKYYAMFTNVRPVEIRVVFE